MSTRRIPGDLVLKVYPRPERSETVPAVTSAERVLEIPTTLTGIWDGPDPAQIPKPPFIMLDIGWHPALAGYGFHDINRMVARLAAHLAADDDEWPAAEAHVRGLPVVDFRFSFIVAPARIPQWENPSLPGLTEKLAAQLDAVDPEGAERLRKLLEPGPCDCGCGCGCEVCGC